MASSATARLLPALLLVTSACSAVSSSDTEAASIPPPPPVVEGVPDPIPAPPADGLFRFVVRPPIPIATVSPEEPSWAVDDDPGESEDQAEDTAEAEDQVGGDVVGASGGQRVDALAPPPDPAWTINQSLLDQIDDDTVIVFEDGLPGFYAQDGEFIALVGSSTASSGAPASRGGGPMTADDFVDELLEIEGVVSAVPVGDGTFAVTTEEPDVLDGRGLGLMVDAPFALAADPYEYYQWTLDNDGQNLNSLSNPPAQSADADIDGFEAKAGARGEGVVVAVIDTGVDFSHPDLAGQSWVNDDETCHNLIDDDGNGYVDDCNGWDFGNEDNTPYGPGQQEHGTHVAGTIAAIADNGVGVVGMAPEVEIMDLNVEGPGGMTMSGISRAVRYAADNGADVINMSLGTQPGTPASAVGSLIDAVRYAEAKGSLVVVAAGNSSVNLDSAAVYPASIEGSNMITVGASAPDETKASFSNYGSPVDLFAPGVLIVSTVPGGGYKFMNGTSMASPTVAGAAAAVLSANPDLDPLGIREQLVGTGDEIAAYGGLAANPVRINQAWAVGIDGDPEEVQVSIAGLAQASTDGVVATVSMSDPGGQFDGEYHWEASLVAIDGSQAYGLVDHPLTVDWVDDTTDDRGAVTIASSAQDQARLETDLPPGTYGLVVEAIPDDDPDVRLGDAFVSTFTVPEDPVPEPDPDPGDGSTTTTVPGNSTTTAPPGATTVPGSTTTSSPGNPTTSTPSTTTSTTTSSGPTTTGWPTTTWAWPTTASPPATSPTTASPTTASPTTASPTTASPTTASPTTAPSSGGGGGGGSPSPTTAPATTSPPTTSPVTTAPSPTTVAPTTTVTNPTTTVATTTPPTTSAGTTPTTSAEGGFAVYSIYPNAGYINQQTMVNIDGSFPSMVNVWFGDQPGDIIHHSTTWIIVVAPPRSQASTVDVTFRSASAGTVLLAQNAFTYVDPTGGGQPTTSTTLTTPTTSNPTTSTTSGNGGGATTSTTSGNGGGITTTSTTSPGNGGGDGGSGDGGDGGSGGDNGTTTSTPGATSTTQGQGSTSTTSATTTSSTQQQTTTTPPMGLPRLARASASGDSIDLGGGLRGVPLQGLGGLGDIAACMSEPCRTRRI